MFLHEDNKPESPDHDWETLQKEVGKFGGVHACKGLSFGNMVIGKSLYPWRALKLTNHIFKDSLSWVLYEGSHHGR